jgi:hypothetical protein
MVGEGREEGLLGPRTRIRQRRELTQPAVPAQTAFVAL